MQHVIGAFNGFLKACRLDARILGVAALYIVLILVSLGSLGLYGFPIEGAISLLTIFAATAIFFGGVVFLKELFKTKPDSPVAFTKGYLQQTLTWEKSTRHLPIIVIVSLFLPAFSSFKGSISLFAEYQWDGFWIEADRLIHGQDAWQLIHPLIGYPEITFILGILYIVWLPLLLLALVYFSFLTDRPELRSQFLMTYFSCWAIIGSLCAVLFASVGPCFAYPFLDRPDFLPLMHYLDYADSRYPIWVIHIQDRLAQQLLEQSRDLGAGITAMPSMHVSMAFLYWLGARKINVRLGWIALAYLIAIQIGSIHLAYHYAVDGYFSMLATLLIWKISGLFTSRSFNESAFRTNSETH